VAVFDVARNDQWSEAIWRVIGGVRGWSYR
jgi:hypothetical protein